jgi:hypothetical protein
MQARTEEMTVMGKNEIRLLKSGRAVGGAEGRFE